jgi:hemerythrin
MNPGESMHEFDWKHSYETGLDRIDNEHRVFLDLVKEFAESIDEDLESPLFVRLAHEIYKYADFHFFSEERMMEKIGYPDTARHKQAHALLLEELREFIDSLSMDRSRGKAMADFLVRWFLSHTVSEDTKLASCINRSKALTL